MKRPRILLVDDDSERHLGALAESSSPPELDSVTPWDLTGDHLRGVDVVSVDEELGEEWAAKLDSQLGATLISSQALDGLSVAGVLRSYARSKGTPFAVALHSAKLEGLSGGLPRAFWEPLVAGQHDLEWAFDLSDPKNVSWVDRIGSMGEAVQTLQKGSTDERDLTWLRVPQAPWRSTAIDQVFDARPPVGSLATNSHGLSLLRWLAQRVLPYPTFLLDELAASNLLGITVDSFRSLGELAPNLRPYAGALKDFAGERWWVAELQFELLAAGSDPFDPPSKKAAALESRLNVSLEPLTSENPVVTLTAEGFVDRRDVPFAETVRLAFDGWPAFADDPRATVDAVRANGNLFQLVPPAERRKRELHATSEQ